MLLFGDVGHGHSHGDSTSEKSLNQDNGHGYGHSHAKENGHGHSHGLGHLGQGVQQRVPEEIPDTFKPAEQKFDLPLSAQFGSHQPSSYQEPSVPEPEYQDAAEDVLTTTETPVEDIPVTESYVEYPDEEEEDAVYTPAYQTTPSPVPQEDPGSGEQDAGFLSSLGSMFGVTTESGVSQEEQGL